MNRTELDTLIKYYEAIASNKERRIITNIVSKEKPTSTELKQLKEFIFRYKMRMEACSINVDSRLEKLHRPNPTSTGRITYK
jgi:F0F1-type ATP synthase delta subunit